jgi:hypothetical protein
VTKADREQSEERPGKELHMTVSILFVIASIILFIMGITPKVQKPWMMGVGMALFAASFLPYFGTRVG